MAIHLFSMSALLNIPTLMTGADLESRQSHHRDGDWAFKNLVGRFVEIRSVDAGSALTFATSKILEAQRIGEPVAWVSALDSLFYPPDLFRAGIDLLALPIVRAQSPQLAAISAHKLMKSGAFGLIALDLGCSPWFAEPLQNRIARAAEEFRTAVLCITRERRDERQLGPLVSLRVDATRDGDFRCTLFASKDKRDGPGWAFEEVRGGTPGMR